MTETKRTDAAGPSTRAAVLAGASVVLILLTAFFGGVYVAPVVQVHLVVRDPDYSNMRRGYVERLGGEKRARERLRECLYLPRWAAPDRYRTADLLRWCEDGEAELVEILNDPRAPLDARLSIPAVLVAETDNEMDIQPRPWIEEFEKALDDPCGRVRVAAAAGLLQDEVCSMLHDPDEQSRIGKASAVLVEALRDPDVAVRRDAAEALADIGAFLPRDMVIVNDPAIALEKAVTPALKEALKDGDAAVREAAKRALSSMPWYKFTVMRLGRREEGAQEEKSQEAPPPRP